MHKAQCVVVDTEMGNIMLITTYLVFECREKYLEITFVPSSPFESPF